MFHAIAAIKEETQLHLDRGPSKSFLTESEDEVQQIQDKINCLGGFFKQYLPYTPTTS